MVRRLYLYAHLLPELASPDKVTALCTPFPGSLYPPAPDKNTRRWRSAAPTTASS